MPAQRYLQIARQIALRLAPVENIGKVHTHLRDFRTIVDDDAFRTVCIDDRQNCVACWFIQRTGFEEKLVSHTRHRRVSEYVLTGFYARDETRNTEVLFQELLDAISDAFSPHSDLSGEVLYIEPVQAPAIGYATIGGSADGNVLCHHAELNLQVIEYFANANEEGA